MKVTLDTPIIELHKCEAINLTKAAARKLALAVAGIAGKTDASEAIVEDLLNYLPMRYEDRSRLVQIDELYDGMEASLELFARVSGGFQVGKNRSPKAPKLFIFEITAGDAERTRKPVVVWWFVSGRQAFRVINYYKERFARGTRFVAYGKWEWDARKNTYALRLTKPDELEILPNETDFDSYGLLKEISNAEFGEDGEKGGRRDGEKDEASKENLKSKIQNPKSEEDEFGDEESDPRLAMIHTGRRVPVYRKLGEFQTKRLREIIFNLLQNVDESSVKENLPDELVTRQKLVGRFQALREIHFPPENSN
ncbi:MAG: hypothetical protein ACR2GD_01845, partial [Pyrinomonadaceae bacterium]